MRIIPMCIKNASLPTLVMPTCSSTTSGEHSFRHSSTEAWKRGHKYRFLTKSPRITLDT